MNEAVAHAFLERFAHDREAGRELSLEEYQALWPGHEDVVEREYRAVTSDEVAGGRIAHYVIEEELGRGAQGVVYRARDERLDRPVALKVLRRRVGDDVKVLLRFQREARAASRLDHRGICTVFDSGVEAGVTYIAMQLVEGEPLAPSDDLDRVAAVVERVARALHAAHEAGVIHRDLKPGNILVQPDGQPVLLDFGLAGGPDTGPTLTATGDVFGTPAYMAPEQLRGAAVDRRADVYALGVCLFEAATGRLPHDAATLESLYKQILLGHVLDPRALNPAIPKDLAVVIRTAMDRDVNRRYATADLLAEDLRRLRAKEPILARPASAWLRLRRWTQRNPALAGLIVVVVTALAIALYLREQAAENRRLAQKVEVLREMERRERVAGLVRTGYQAAFGLEVARAPALFAEALAEDPDNAPATVGLFILALPDRDKALSVLEKSANRDIVWLKKRWQGAPDDGAMSRSDLRPFLDGLLRVNFFSPPVAAAAAKEALRHFRTAAMRKRRWHVYHSWMMAAHHARDVAAMKEAEEAMVYHWPDVQATWEAIAQFFLPFDRDKAVAAMRRMLELGPSAPAHLGLAFVAPDETTKLHHLDEAVRTNPALAEAQLVRAQALRAAGRDEDAARGFVEAVVHAPPHFSAYAVEALNAHVTDAALLREAARRRPDLAAKIRNSK